MKRDFILSRYGKIDPISLTAIAGLATAGMGAASLASMNGSGAGPAPASAPPPTPPPSLSPVGTKSGGATDSRQPSFVGASSMPSPGAFGQGGKTLLGQ